MYHVSEVDTGRVNPFPDGGLVDRRTVFGLLTQRPRLVQCTGKDWVREFGRLTLRGDRSNLSEWEGLGPYLSRGGPEVVRGTVPGKGLRLVQNTQDFEKVKRLGKNSFSYLLLFIFWSITSVYKVCSFLYCLVSRSFRFFMVLVVV